MAGETLAGFHANQGQLMAAGLAYYLLISASPLLVIAVAIVGAILGREEAQLAVRERFESALGPDAAEAATELVRDVEFFSGGLVATLIALAVLSFGSTRAFAALTAAMNRIWERRASSIRGGVLLMVRSRLLAFAMVLGAGLLLLATLAVETAGAGVESVLERHTSLDPELGSLGNRLALFGIRVFVLAALYRWLPARPVAWRDVWPAALLAVLLLNFGHALIGLYVAHSGVRSAYGAAGSFIVLLFSFYFLSLVVLLGAQFAKVNFDRRRAAPEIRR